MLAVRHQVADFGAAFVVTLMLVGCAATEREQVESAANERWGPPSAMCKHRVGNRYGFLLVGARIRLGPLFTNDFRSLKKHGCFHASRGIDVSMTAAVMRAHAGALPGGLVCRSAAVVCASAPQYA